MSEASILVLEDLRWSMCLTKGPKSRKMPLKDRISPIRNPYLARPLPFLPGLLTPILSVRSSILLGQCREEHCRTGLQDRAAGSWSSKTLQGSVCHPTTLWSDLG